MRYGKPRPMTLEWWLAFFEQLEDAFPPAGERHHTVSRTEYGSEDTSWESKLTLNIGTQTFFLSSEDLNKPVEDVVAEVKALLEKIDEGK